MTELFLVTLQSMTPEMQLRHYELQRQQFIPLFQEWSNSFILWHEHFQSYHHKDQLQDYERQWKQWQEQMNATNGHLQERVATLTAMVPLSSNQSNNAVTGQFSQYPGQDLLQQQHKVNADMPISPATHGPNAQGPTAGPPGHGAGPRTVGPLNAPLPGFNVRGPRLVVKLLGLVRIC